MDRIIFLVLPFPHYSTAHYAVSRSYSILYCSVHYPATYLLWLLSGEYWKLHVRAPAHLADHVGKLVNSSNAPGGKEHGSLPPNPSIHPPTRPI
jgi:hypothetical protein